MKIKEKAVAALLAVFPTAESLSRFAEKSDNLIIYDSLTEGNRLVRKFGDIALYLDFLTEDPPSVTGARVVDD